MKLSMRGAMILVALGASVLTLSGCVSSDYRDAHFQASQNAVIHHACGGIMGLHPGEVLHRDCVSSLGQSAVYAGGLGAEATHRTARERNACAHIGLIPGTAPFLNCVSNLNATMAAYNSGGNH